MAAWELARCHRLEEQQEAQEAQEAGTDPRECPREPPFEIQCHPEAVVEASAGLRNQLRPQAYLLAVVDRSQVFLAGIQCLLKAALEPQMSCQECLAGVQGQLVH